MSAECRDRRLDEDDLRCVRTDKDYPFGHEITGTADPIGFGKLTKTGSQIASDMEAREFRYDVLETVVRRMAEEGRESDGKPHASGSQQEELFDE